MNGVYQDGQVVGAGVDYIAATASAGRRARTLRRIGEGEVSVAISRGERERAWSAWGYSGVAAGGASVGSGPAGAIVRISGSGAANICGEIIRVADKVSRIDLQTTIRFTRDVGALARRSGQELQRNQRERKRRISSRLEHTFGRGDTLYVGSRNSQWFGRLYDKHRESGEEAYRRCWRYEIEAKDDAAQKAARFVNSVGYSSEAIAGAIGDWYRARGVTPRYQPTMAGGIGVVGAAPTDARRQLMWLSHQVAPVVSRLAEVYGMDAVLGVLSYQTDLSTVAPIRREGDELLAEYDAWTVDSVAIADDESAT